MDPIKAEIDVSIVYTSTGSERVNFGNIARSVGVGSGKRRGRRQLVQDRRRRLDPGLLECLGVRLSDAEE